MQRNHQLKIVGVVHQAVEATIALALVVQIILIHLLNSLDVVLIFWLITTRLGRTSTGMASMMDEMAKTLARRRAQAEKKPDVIIWSISIVKPIRYVV